MSTFTLRRFVRALLEQQKDPRVPTQLIKTDDAIKDDDSIPSKSANRQIEDDVPLEEFCAVGGGAIAGVAAGPFGGNASNKKKKK